VKASNAFSMDAFVHVGQDFCAGHQQDDDGDDEAGLWSGLG